MSAMLGDDDREVILPRARVLAPRRGPWALVLVLLALAPIAMLVRQSQRTEAMLEAASASAQRVIVHELRPGASIRLQLSAETEAVRIVTHAFGEPSLTPAAHLAELDVRIDAGDATREEHLVLSLPGTGDRTTTEDPGLAAGDPFASSIDLAGLSARQLTITLCSIASASGVLLRVFRRDAVPMGEQHRRVAKLDDAELARAAARAWEMSWTDLSTEERDALVGFRWRNVAAVGGTGRSHALAIAPPPPRARAAEAPLVWRSTLRAAERASFVARTSTTLLVSAQDRTTIAANVRSLAGDVRTYEGAAELLVEVPAGSSTEISARDASMISVRAEDPGALEERTTALVWRIGPGQPALVAATVAPLVLRVTARAPLARAGRGAGGPAAATTPAARVRVRCALAGRRFLHEAGVEPSALDRYAGVDPDAAPSEPTTFYAVVPAGEAVQLDSDEPLDVALAELDPDAPERPIGWPAGAPARSLHLRGEPTWRGFVPRRPTNAAALESRTLHIGRAVAPIPSRDLPRTLHVRRPRHLPASTIDSETFVEGSAIELDVMTIGVPVSIPVHVKASAPVIVSVAPNGSVARSASLRAPGVATRVTVPRVIREPDARAVVVLGDDLAPGQKTLRFESSAPIALHVPWESRPAPPRWSEGDYEP